MVREGAKQPTWSDGLRIPLLGEKASFSVVNREGVIVFESEAVFDSLGYRVDEVVGQRGRFLIHPDDLDEVWKLANVAWEGTRGTREVRFRHKDGSTRWMEINLTRLDPEHLLNYRHDVTARRLAEEALRRSNLLLAAIAGIQAAYIESPDVLPFRRLLDAFVAATESTQGVFAMVADAGEKATLEIVEQSELATEALSRVDALQALLHGGQPIEQRGEHAFLPLRGSDGSLFGVVILAGRPGGYSEAAIEACRPLKLTATRLLDSDRGRRGHADAEQEVELLKTFAFAIAEAKDLESALSVMVRTLVERTGWELGQTWVPTMDRLRLEATSAWFTSDHRYDAFREASCALQLGPGEGMAGRVWMTKEPCWVDATEAASRGFPRVAIAREVGLVVSFCAPIIADGEVVALLEFFSSRRRREDQRMLELVAACAAQVASILERKRGERGFHVLAAAMRDMRDAATVITQRGENLTLEYANPAYYQLTGFDLADIVGRDPTFLFGPATDAAIIERVKKESAIGRTSRFEIFLYDAHGKARELDFTNTPVPNAAGTEITHITFWREVERDDDRAPASIDEAEIAWRQTFDAIASPIVIVGSSGTIGAINRSAAQLVGEPGPALVGRALDEVGTGEPWISTRLLLDDVMRSGTPREARIVDVATGRSWELSVNALGESRGAIVVLRDGASRSAARESWTRVETLAMLGRIVGGVAHEVRNPLFGISATLDAFEARFGGREEFESYVRVLRGELGRLAELVNDLLAYGRPQRLRRTHHDLQEVLDEVVALGTTASNAAGIVLRREPAPASVRVRIDRARAVQAVLHLVDAAILRSSPAGSVTLHVLSDGKTAIVEVKDDGPAIPSEDLARLFEPFFFRRTGGTGLGLSIVQRIIEQHDGHVSADNRAEGGVVMRVSFPIETPDGE